MRKLGTLIPWSRGKTADDCVASLAELNAIQAEKATLAQQSAELAEILSAHSTPRLSVHGTPAMPPIADPADTATADSKSPFVAHSPHVVAQTVTPPTASTSRMQSPREEAATNAERILQHIRSTGSTPRSRRHTPKSASLSTALDQLSLHSEREYALPHAVPSY